MTLRRNAAGLACALLCTAAPAWAQLAPAEELESYRLRTEALERKVKQLERTQREAQVASEEAILRVTQRLSRVQEKPTDLKVFWKDGLNFSTRDKQISLNIGGRLLYDAIWMDEDSDLAGFPAIGDQIDGTRARAARLHMAGTLFENTDFKVEIDFAGTGENTAVFKDVFLGFKDLVPGAYLKIGHFKEPFGLDQLTSGRFTTFMERALPDVFSPSRNAGVQLSSDLFNKRMTWAVGAFRETNEQGYDQTEGGYSYTARVTGTPIYEDDGRKLLHLGLAGSWRHINGTVRYRQRPEMSLASRFVDTGDLAADNAWQVGTEAALVLGPFSLQNEFVHVDLDRDGASNARFWGSYLQASYFLTGENRAYSTSSGAFSRVRPKKNFQRFKDGSRGWGAWEVAARYSYLDLNDSDVQGGELGDVTLGLNWHLNPNMRIMANYTRAMLNDRGPAGIDGNADLFGLRFQIDF